MPGVTLWEKVFVKNERIYQSRVTSAKLYGSEIWCLRKNEMAIMRRIKKAMRAMCGVKLIEITRRQEFMSLLGLKNTLNGPARTSGVRWYGHVLKKNTGDVLRRALDFKLGKEEGVGNQIGLGKKLKNILIRLGRKRKMPLTEQSGVIVFATFKKLEVNPATCVNAGKTRFKKK